MKKTDLIKGILKLGENLDKDDSGMGAVMIIDDMEMLVDKYENEQLKLCGVGVMLPKNEKLWSMAGIIANRIQVALSEDLILDKQQFDDLQEEWFDWLEDKISGN